MYVKDLEGNEFTCQITTTQKYILNSNITLSAEILPSKVNKSFINKIEKMWRLYDDDDVEHIILFTKRQGKGDLLTVKIDAIPRILDVMETTRIYEEYNQHMTANAAFTILFNALPFNFTLVDNFPAQDWEGFGAGETTLETFKRCLERYGAEYKFVGNMVYLYKIVGRDTQFQYRHRLNADNILEETDANTFYTYAKGYGDYADGEESENGGWQNAALIREYTSPIAQIPSIGIRHAPPIKNGNIKVSTFMMEQLKTLVDTSLAISVSANIYDLRQQGYELAQPELGDRVFLIDERIEFNETVRIVEIEITKNYRREITELKLTFGTPGLVQRYLSKFNTAAKNITEIFSGQKQLPESAYSAAVKQATKDLTNARSELVFPDQGGIWSVDPSNPNYMTAFTSKGFGVSEDGGGSFKSALTGRGLVAEQIYGKIIAGDRLEIRNQEGTFIVDGGLVTIAGGALNILGGITDANIASAEQWHGQGTYIDDQGVYTGTLNANQVVVGKFADEVIQNADKWNNQGTYIDGTGVYTGRLNANQIQVGTIGDKFITSASEWNNQGTFIDTNGVYTGTVSATQVLLGFNNIGNNVKITTTGLETYNGANLTSRLYDAGHEFFRNGNRVGKIGTAAWFEHPEHRGLSFQLDSSADYFSFGLEEDIEDVYSAKLMWHKNDNATAKGFTMNDDLGLAGDLTVRGATGIYANRGINALTLHSRDTVTAGSKAKMLSSGSGTRIYAAPDVWLYINENGQVGMTYKGTSYSIFTI